MLTKLISLFNPHRAKNAKRGTIYSYQIRDLAGNQKKGKISASSLADAIRILERQSEAILALEKAPYDDSLDVRRISLYDTMVFFRELEVMFKSGLSLQRALTVLENQQGDDNARNLMHSLKKAIESGLAFSDALGLFPSLFPTFHLGIIKAGEKGGFMGISLNHLAIAIEKDMELRKKIKAALEYPITVFLLGIVITIGAFYLTLPHIIDLIRDLHIALPLHTRLLLSTFSFLSRPPVMISLIACALFVIARWSMLTRKYITSKPWWEKAVFSTPIVRDIVTKALMTQNFIILQALVSSGIPVSSATQLLFETCENGTFREAFRSVHQDLYKGKTLGEGMERFPRIFPRRVISMVAIGEESGTLESMLEKVIFLNTIELDAAITSFTKFIEPMAIAALGFMMGGVLLFFFVPIYSALYQTM
jgi:type IV pilus assembly protein PilC